MSVPHSGAPSQLAVTADAVLRKVTATSGRFKGEPSFDLMAYGAVGDGSTDDTDAIQDALDAASAFGRGIANGSGRTYKVTSTLTIDSNVHLRDMTLDASSLDADDNVLEATGELATAVLLSDDAAAGDTTISVASATGIAVDDWLLVSSTSVFGSTSQPRGEVVRVAFISGSDITLYDPLADDYATADDAQIEGITFVEQVQLERVNIIGPTDDTLTIKGLAAELVRDLVVRDCTFTQTHYSGISLVDVVGARIEGCHFDRITEAGLAYGIVVLWACQDIAITACTGNRLRHLVSVGGGTTQAGIARRVAVTGCIASQCMDAGFDCHPSGEDISFVGNHVFGSDSVGITFQGSRGVIANNTVRDTVSHGIMVQPLTIKAHDVVVGGNTIKDAGGRGILVTTNASYTNFHGFIIANNSIQTAASAGIDVDGSSAGGIVGLVVSGNLVRGTTSNVISVRSCNYASVSGNTVEVITNSTSGIRFLTVTRGSITGNTIKCTATTSTKCVTLSASDDCTVTGNTGTGAAIGILFDSTCDHNTVMSNNMRSNTTPLSLSTGTGNISDTGDESGAYNAV